MRYQKILCAVDFSECSREALARAAELARESSAELTLVHTYEIPVFEGSAYVANIVEQARAGAEDDVTRWVNEAKTLGAPQVKGVALMGVAWDEIVRYAQDQAIDLIVMGTHGRTGLKRAVIGSVAETVVRHAPCTVMTVRQARKAAA